MYKVIQFFTDLQDNNHPYGVGDTFPRNGMSVSQERIEELAGSNNKQGKPLIKKVEEKTSEDKEPEKVAEKKYTKTDINRMSTSDLKELATEKKIENAQDMSGAELKKVLIKELGI